MHVQVLVCLLALDVCCGLVIAGDHAGHRYTRRNIIRHKTVIRTHHYSYKVKNSKTTDLVTFQTSTTINGPVSTIEYAAHKTDLPFIRESPSVYRRSHFIPRGPFLTQRLAERSELSGYKRWQNYQHPKPYLDALHRSPVQVDVSQRMIGNFRHGMQQKRRIHLQNTRGFPSKQQEKSSIQRGTTFNPIRNTPALPFDVKDYINREPAFHTVRSSMNKDSDTSKQEHPLRFRDDTNQESVSQIITPNINQETKKNTPRHNIQSRDNLKHDPAILNVVTKNKQETQRNKPRHPIISRDNVKHDPTTLNVETKNKQETQRNKPRHPIISRDNVKHDPTTLNVETKNKQETQRNKPRHPITSRDNLKQNPTLQTIRRNIHQEGYRNTPRHPIIFRDNRKQNPTFETSETILNQNTNRSIPRHPTRFRDNRKQNPIFQPTTTSTKQETNRNALDHPPSFGHNILNPALKTRESSINQDPNRKSPRHPMIFGSYIDQKHAHTTIRQDTGKDSNKDISRHPSVSGGYIKRNRKFQTVTPNHEQHSQEQLDKHTSGYALREQQRFHQRPAFVTPPPTQTTLNHNSEKHTNVHEKNDKHSNQKYTATEHSTHDFTASTELDEKVRKNDDREQIAKPKSTKTDQWSNSKIFHSQPKTSEIIRTNDNNTGENVYSAIITKMKDIDESQGESSFKIKKKHRNEKTSGSHNLPASNKHHIVGKSKETPKKQSPELFYNSSSFYNKEKTNVELENEKSKSGRSNIIQKQGIVPAKINDKHETPKNLIVTPNGEDETKSNYINYVHHDRREIRNKSEDALTETADNKKDNSKEKIIKTNSTPRIEKEPEEIDDTRFNKIEKHDINSVENRKVENILTETNNTENVDISIKTTTESSRESGTKNPQVQLITKDKPARVPVNNQTDFYKNIAERENTSSRREVGSKTVKDQTYIPGNILLGIARLGKKSTVEIDQTEEIEEQYNSEIELT